MILILDLYGLTIYRITESKTNKIQLLIRINQCLNTIGLRCLILYMFRPSISE